MVNHAQEYGVRHAFTPISVMGKPVVGKFEIQFGGIRTDNKIPLNVSNDRIKFAHYFSKK
jgi:hypothetical protein